MKAVFNCRRGLAIDSLSIKRVSERTLLGTIPHGYYQDIALGADFYSGHLVMETPGRPKLTDLEPVEPDICAGDDPGNIMLRGCVNTSLGPVLKTIWVTREGQIRLRFELQWEQLPVGSLRLGHITMHPEAFDPESLFFETHNGGVLPERFALEKKGIEHGRSVSFLVSSSSSLGMTEGVLKMGDREHAIVLQTPLDQASVVAQMTYVPVPGSFFYRASFSAAELDDTCRDRPRGDFPRIFEFTISADSSCPRQHELETFRADWRPQTAEGCFGDLNLLQQLRNLANPLRRIEPIPGRVLCILLAVVVPGSIKPTAQKTGHSVGRALDRHTRLHGKTAPGALEKISESSAPRAFQPGFAGLRTTLCRPTPFSCESFQRDAV